MDPCPAPRRRPARTLTHRLRWTHASPGGELARVVGLAALALVLGACGRTDGSFAGGGGVGSTDTAPGSTEATEGGPGTSTPSTTGQPPGTATAQPTTATDTDAETDGPEPGGECRVADDCRVFEPDPCLLAACELGRCVYAPLDRDGDGLAPLACGGADCNDANPFTFPGAPEDCFDGDDNDCNGVADCADPVCRDVPDCGCIAETSPHFSKQPESPREQWLLKD